MDLSVGAVGRRLTPLRVVVAAALLLAGLAIIVGAGYERSDIEFGNGTAWVLNADGFEGRGEIVHVTGPSEERGVDVRLQNAFGEGDDVELITASEQSIYLLNRTVGQIRRMDPRAGAFDARNREDVASGDGVSAEAGPDSLYVLDSDASEVLVLDPIDLDVVARHDMSEGRLVGAANADDVLFVVDPGSAELVRIKGDEELGRSPLDIEPGAQTEVAVFGDGEAGVFDFDSGTWVLPQEDASPLPRGDGTEIKPDAGFSQDPSYAAGSRWVTLDPASADARVDEDIAEQDRLGRPFTESDRTFIADPDTGEVLVLDAETGQLLHRPQVVDRGQFLTLTASDRYGFAVLKGTSRGFIIDPDGEVTDVRLDDPDANQFRDGEDVTPEREVTEAEGEVIQEEFADASAITPPTTQPPPVVDTPDETDPPVQVPVTQTCSDGSTQGACTTCSNGSTTRAGCTPCTDGSTAFQAACPASCSDGTSATATCSPCDNGSTLSSCAVCTVGQAVPPSCPVNCDDGTKSTGSCVECDNGNAVSGCVQCDVMTLGASPAFGCDGCDNGTTSGGCLACSVGLTTQDCETCATDGVTTVPLGRSDMCPAAPPTTAGLSLVGALIALAVFRWPALLRYTRSRNKEIAP